MEENKEHYFDDYQENDQFFSQERIISEEDIVNFSRLTGDHNPIHVDQEYANRSMYGKRIAHGMLGLSIISGLAAGLGISRETTLAFRSLEWKFKEPIYIGDCVRAVFKVHKKKRLSGQDGGMIVFRVRVLNQQNRVIQTGKWSLIIAYRPG